MEVIKVYFYVSVQKMIREGIKELYNIREVISFSRILSKIVNFTLPPLFSNGCFFFITPLTMTLNINKLKSMLINKINLGIRKPRMIVITWQPTDERYIKVEE